MNARLHDIHSHTGPVFLALALALGSTLIPTNARAQTIVIDKASVYTGPGKLSADTTIVIRDGRIRALGKKVAVPRGAKVIDGRGKIVTAGFLATGSRLGLTEVSLESSTREGFLPSGGDDIDDVVYAAFRVADGYHGTSVAIPVARAQGVTTAVAVPTGGLISGSAAAFSLADGLTPDLLIADPVAMYASLGENAMGSAKGSRSLALLRLREVLDDARTYGRQKRAYERNQMRDMTVSRLDLEALQPVLAGRVPLVLRANRSSDILAGIRLGQDYGLQVIIEGATEAWLVADQLAKANVGVIVDPSANLPDSFDRINVRDDNPKLLAEAGVQVAIARIGSTHNVGEMRQLAGIAVANGMQPDHALAAVTTVPAQLFGIDRGTVAVGATADMVVWSGDPFELSTRAEHILIAGKEQDLKSRQELLFERYRTLP